MKKSEVGCLELVWSRSWLYVLDTYMKRDAKLLRVGLDSMMPALQIRWSQTVMVNWEHLAQTPVFKVFKSFFLKNLLYPLTMLPQLWQLLRIVKMWKMSVNTSNRGRTIALNQKLNDQFCLINSVSSSPLNDKDFISFPKKSFALYIFACLFFLTVWIFSFVAYRHTYPDYHLGPFLASLWPSREVCVDWWV